MLVAGLLLKLVLAASVFGLARVDQPTLRWTDPVAMLAAAQVPLGANLFDVRTAPIEARLEALPGVAAARVSVALPDALVIQIDERVPLLAWQVGEASYLVDGDGVLFAAADPAAIAAAGLPVVVDDRVGSIDRLFVGARLDPIDLDVATRLGALKPSDVGSTARALQVEVGDDNGYTLQTGPASWTAIFGFYSPGLRDADLIPGQVRLLRSLLADREAVVAKVFLAGEKQGTYIPKPTSSH